MFDMPFSNKNGDSTGDLTASSSITNVTKFVVVTDMKAMKDVPSESVNLSSINNENIEANVPTSSYETLVMSTTLASSPTQRSTYSIMNESNEKSKGMASIFIEPLIYLISI